MADNAQGGYDTFVFDRHWPFVAIQILGLLLCLAYLEIILWLPRVAGLLE